MFFWILKNNAKYVFSNTGLRLTVLIVIGLYSHEQRRWRYEAPSLSGSDVIRPPDHHLH